MVEEELQIEEAMKIIGRDEKRKQTMQKSDC